MNRIYKVIYSKARQCAMVVSELAKSSHKSSRKGAGHAGTPALARMVAATLVAGTLTWGGVPGVSWAADNPIVTDSNGNVDKKIAVIFDDKGSLMSTDAKISHEILQDSGRFPEGEGQSIALGKGAHAYMQGGSKAKYMLFGMKKAAGAIAIGEGSEALSQSIDIGNRTYTGDIGDVTISKYGNAGSGSGVGSVLLGTNSYTGGTLSTLIGDYSIMSTAYPDAYDSHYGSYLQNAGAVSVGALNSIESATSDNYNSGVANSIVGLANKTNNANGALIYGAGNTITNSFADVATPGSANSAAKAAQSFRESVQNNPGGAALAIGGGNAIDRSIRSQVIGVNNKLAGNTYHKDGYFDDSWNYHPAVDGVSSQYNMIDGYNNTAQNVNHAYVIGANNIIQGKKFSDATKNGVLNDADWEKSQQDDNLIVIGDNHTLANDVANDIILGTADADKKITTSVSNIVMIGHNADAQKEGGVALGAGSVASVDKASTDANAIGYDPATKKASTDTSSTWKSTAAAVSVGDASQNITRQITNLAAGAQDTDAVNVAQLKAAQTHFYSVNSTDATAGNYNNDGAKGKNSLAAGVGALANGSNSVAIGTKAKAQNDALAVGENANAGNNGIAIGMHANAGYGQNMALGYYASVANGVGNSTALGYGSQVTKRDILQSDGSDGVISVGKSVGQSGEKGMMRRIINVKAGVNSNDAANVSQLTELKEGDHISIVDSTTPNEKGQTVKTISVKVDGQIAEGNKGILSGDTVYNEVHVDKDGNYIKSDNTVAGNLKALDGKVKTNADNIEKNSQLIEQNSARIDTNSKNIEKNAKAIEQNSARIDTNSRNIEKNGKNIEILQETKADTNLSNITDAGKTVINNIAKKSVKVEAGSKNVIVEPSDVQDGPITYTVDIAKDLDVNTVKTKNLTVSNSASIGNITINQDGNGTISGLADTTIEQGSKNAVNAGTVYNETRVAKDGNFIRQANTAGENLSALDNQVTSNTQNINYLNGRVGELGDRINKVGAGAAALAALHPLDFDPDDKWDFAAGVGNYRNANAAAVGLFYRPNERTMFNLGWTMGDNRNMVNGGFSVKFGKSNKYVKYSKAEMASVIDNQSREIAELKAKDAQNAKDNAEMRAEIEALKKQVEALAAKK